ncbi:hypothetical protein PHYPSEUDO_002257 [Phytophthora pseudosyringae]|uniref:Uncharacterized protein n=1 Tax=Phytophthora pseudosyringae TaxID=221518 RepID=A0A8T1VWV3_9STRA|nr:hypothetical protein PHYPSEUDO_002257 [Phytophthora pseudosyringae]
MLSPHATLDAVFGAVKQAPRDIAGLRIKLIGPTDLVFASQPEGSAAGPIALLRPVPVLLPLLEREHRAWSCQGAQRERPDTAARVFAKLMHNSPSRAAAETCAATRAFLADPPGVAEHRAETGLGCSSWTEHGAAGAKRDMAAADGWNIPGILSRGAPRHLASKGQPARIAGVQQ